MYSKIYGNTSFKIFYGYPIFHFCPANKYRAGRLQRLAANCKAAIVLNSTHQPLTQWNLKGGIWSSEIQMGSVEKSSINMLKYLCISSYIRKPFLIQYMTSQPIPFKCPYTWGKFSILFYQCDALNGFLHVLPVNFPAPTPSDPGSPDSLIQGHFCISKKDYRVRGVLTPVFRWK